MSTSLASMKLAYVKVSEKSLIRSLHLAVKDEEGESRMTALEQGEAILGSLHRKPSRKGCRRASSGAAAGCGS